MACPGRPQLYSPDGTPYVSRWQGGRCVDFPAWTPEGQGAPLYGSGGFVSGNPNAAVVRQFTDASGQTTADIFTAARGFLGNVCLSNCGSGTGFLGFGGTAADVGRLVAGIASQIALNVSSFGTVYAVGSQLATQVERSQKNMALNLSGILGSVGSVLGGIDTSGFGNISQILGAGANIAAAAIAPTPSYAAAPIYGASPSYPVPMATPTAAGGTSAIFAAGAGMAAAIAARVAPILAKIAVKIGLRARPSLSRAMTLVKKTAKLLGSPEAVAAALGITTAELATLIVSSNQRKRRRMNPANSHALRRAARRIKSFHRLCQHTDLIRTHRRSSYRSGGCMKCGKKRCTC